MQISLVIEYFLLTFISSFATLQIVASLKNKKELKIFGNKKVGIFLALSLIVGSFIWFFWIRDRNVHTLLEGGQLSIIFGLGAFCSLLATKVLKAIYGHN